MQNHVKKKQREREIRNVLGWPSTNKWPCAWLVAAVPENHGQSELGNIEYNEVQNAEHQLMARDQESQTRWTPLKGTTWKLKTEPFRKEMSTLKYIKMTGKFGAPCHLIRRFTCGYSWYILRIRLLSSQTTGLSPSNTNLQELRGTDHTMKVNGVWLFFSVTIVEGEESSKKLDTSNQT